MNPGATRDTYKQQKDSRIDASLCINNRALGTWSRNDETCISSIFHFLIHKILEKEYSKFEDKTVNVIKGLLMNLGGNLH